MNKTDMRHKVLLRLGLAVSFFCLFALIWFNSTTPSIRIDLVSSATAQTQIYLPGRNNQLSEGNTYVGEMFAGANVLSFPLTSRSDWIRWDPVNGTDGHFTLKAVQVRVLFFHLGIPLDHISSISEIASLNLLGNELFISTLPSARDASLKVLLPYKKVLALQAIVAIVLTSLLCLLTLAVIRSRKSLGTLVEACKALIRLDSAALDALPKLCIIAFIFWFSSLAAYSISIDQEFAAFQLGRIAWVGQGRWTTYLLTQYVLPQPVVPFLPHFIFCISAALSYVYILQAHRISANRKALVLFPIYMAYPTWYFIGEFYANILSISVGLILCSVALLTFERSMPAAPGDPLFGKRLVWLLPLQAILVGTAIGTYQSYLFAFCSMGLGVIIFRSAQGHQALQRQTWKQVAYLALTIAAGALFYWIALELFRFFLTPPKDNYAASFINLATLVDQSWAVLWSTLQEATHFFSGSRTVFGVSIGATGLILLLGFAGVAHSAGSWKALAWMVILVAACMLAPFSISLLAGGAGTVPYRSIVAAPYIVWLFAAIALYSNKAYINRLALAALVIALFQLLNASSTYSAARALTLAHDQALAAAVYERITEQIPDFRRSSQQKIDFSGTKSYTGVFPRVPTTTIGGSFFAWDGGSPLRIYFFMKLLGYEGLTLASTKEHDKLKSTYAEMPSWPAVGAVRKVGDIVLVNLGGAGN